MALSKITMSRDGEGFAVFSDGSYAVRIDGRFDVREKIGVVAEAFVVKGGWKLEDAASAAGAAIAAAES